MISCMYLSPYLNISHTCKTETSYISLSPSLSSKDATHLFLELHQRRVILSLLNLTCVNRMA